MRWITGRIKRIIIKNNIRLNINKEIPGDLFHLEFNSIDICKDHDDQKYLYIITDTLNNYKDDDTVLFFDTFFIKYNGELIDTSISIIDYITR